MKCKSGFRQVGNKCIRKRKYLSEFRDGIPQKNKNVRYLCIFTLIILGFILVINISDIDTVKPLLISIFFVLVPLVIYSLKEYQDDLIGLIWRKIPMDFVWALIFAGGFFLITSIVPFFTLAYPRYPNAIGEGLKWVLIVLGSPVTESLFFQCTIFAFIRNFVKKYPGKYKYLFILIVSLMFSIFHLGSYLAGIYFLNVSQTLTAFTSNISAFITAFLFSFVAMVFALRKGVENSNLGFIIFFHIFLNFIAYGLAVVGFI